MFIFNFIVNKGGKEEDSNRVLEHRDLVYGSLISFKGLQSDRPKCRGMLVNPRAFQSHAEIGVFVPRLNYTYQSEKFKFFVS